MARLYRPHIPLETRVRVALRQLGEIWVDDWIEAKRDSGKSFGAMLDELLDELRAVLHAEKLHLDHDPPLAARQRVPYTGGTSYIPDANDPEHLIYREAVAHGIKTRVRGEHGQYSDLALIKREKRRLNKNTQKKRPLSRFANVGFKAGKRKMKSPKRPWPKRKFEKRTR